MNNGILRWSDDTIAVDHKRSRTCGTFQCRLTVALVCVLSFGGCASARYSAGSAQQYYSSSELADMSGPRIERGRPNRVVDTLGWIWGIPQKIILFDRRVENHAIDQRTESEMAAYLHDNELSTVKVRLNQYHPGDDWKRLVANKSVGAGWRYTLGTLTVLGETVLPGRVFGGDHYNPFTDTIHVYSNIPAIAYHEGGHAKDFARRKWKGTYAAAYFLPIVPLYHEAIATNDALSYVRSSRSVAEEQEAVKILYPAYGTYVGSAIPAAPFGYVVGVIGGHAAGRYQSWQLERAQQSNVALRGEGSAHRQVSHVVP